MNVLLIRHGQTKGNLEGRYIGCHSDEPLCPEGIQALKQIPRLPVIRVFASPMKRCLETASILYPELLAEPVYDLRECDFGLFEGKNYDELNGLPAFQAWIDSNGSLPFPGGESRSSFSDRSVAAFRQLLPVIRRDPCAMILHGGTIMAIMEAFAKPTASYFSYQVLNGQGFLLDVDTGHYLHFPSTSPVTD